MVVQQLPYAPHMPSMVEIISEAEIGKGEFSQTGIELFHQPDPVTLSLGLGQTVTNQYGFGVLLPQLLAYRESFTFTRSCWAPDYLSAARSGSCFAGGTRGVVSTVTSAASKAFGEVTATIWALHRSQSHSLG